MNAGVCALASPNTSSCEMTLVYRTLSGALCDNWCFRSCPSAAVNSVGHRESTVTSELPAPRWFV